jgi:hypothetical protein
VDKTAEDLKERTKRFAVSILQFVETLANTPSGQGLARQLVRSGTGVAGNYRSWRYSPLNQVTRDNARKLKLKWVYQMQTTHTVETTPLVADGKHCGFPSLHAKRERRFLSGSQATRFAPHLRIRAIIL